MVKERARLIKLATFMNRNMMTILNDECYIYNINIHPSIYILSLLDDDLIIIKKNGVPVFSVDF